MTCYQPFCPLETNYLTFMGIFTLTQKVFSCETKKQISFGHEKSVNSFKKNSLKTAWSDYLVFTSFMSIIYLFIKFGDRKLNKLNKHIPPLNVKWWFS